jgi:soluble lytic murein transglycosylase-like protein
MISIEQKAEIKKNVLFFAGQYDLDSALVASVIFQESRGNRKAARYENGFFLRYLSSAATRHDLLGFVPPRDSGVSIQTEIRARAFSWGLMQCMGQTAREFGYAKNELWDLQEIPDGIEMGCKILVAKLKKASDDVREGLLLYNGGGDASYPDSVLGHLSSKEYEKIWA